MHRPVIFLTLFLSVAVPRQAAACDPNCDQLVFLVSGTPAAFGTVVIAPLVGLALDKRPDRPYGEALAVTTLAAATGWTVGFAVTAPSGDQVRGAEFVVLAAIPVVLGTAATYLTYRFWPRPERADARTAGVAPPALWIAPRPGGVTVGANLRL